MTVLGDEMRRDRLGLLFSLRPDSRLQDHSHPLYQHICLKWRALPRDRIHHTRLMLEESMEDAPLTPTQSTLLILELKASSKSSLILAVLTTDGEST